MSTTIVYIDEAGYALKLLAPLLQRDPARGPAHWIVVGCAPRITQRVSKWVTHSARESWRGKWAEKAFAQIVPVLQASGASVITQVANGSLDELTASLQARHAGAHVLDARRPRPDHSPRAFPGKEADGVWGCATLLAGAGLLFAAD
jgi:hypothetical protein